MKRPSDKSKWRIPYPAFPYSVLKELGNPTGRHWAMLKSVTSPQGSGCTQSPQTKAIRNICQKPIQLCWQMQGMGRRQTPYRCMDFKPGSGGEGQAEIWKRREERLMASGGWNCTSLGCRYIALSRNQVGSIHCHGRELTVHQRKGQDGGWHCRAICRVSQDVKKYQVAERGTMGFDEEILRNAVMMQHLISAFAFRMHGEGAGHVFITHLLWLNERASKMCRSAFIRNNVNQETDFVYVKWLIFNVCRIWGKKSGVIISYE